MFTGQALVELFGALVNEMNTSSSVVLALALIATGITLLVMSRRRGQNQAL
jgi:hypothetical protein